MARHVVVLIILALASSARFSAGQSTPPHPAVIDVHTHFTVEGGPPIMDALNIRYALVMGDRERWAKLEGLANRFLPSLSFPCPDGVPLFFGGPTCHATGSEFPDVAWIRDEVRAGRIRAFGELLPQFLGLPPGDSKMEPYWEIAEEFDIPVGIHMGPGPSGIAYAKSPMPKSHPEFKRSCNT